MTRARKPQPFRGISEAELAVLVALWKSPGAPNELQERLAAGGAAWAYTTVQTLLHRLLRKGFVARRREGVAQIYSASIDRDELVARHVSDLAERLCDGAMSPLVLSLVKTRRFSKGTSRASVRCSTRPRRTRGGRPMFSWLAFNTLCALPLALLAFAARRLPRVSPAVEHVLWLLVLVRLVLPPLSLAGSEPASAPGAPALVSSGPPSLGDELVAATTRLLGTNWSSWGAEVLLGAFLAALFFVLARELRRAHAVERCVARAGEAGLELERHVRRLADRLGVAARVRVSPEAGGPFLWSLRRPVLVLPASAELPACTVVAHGLAHLRRRDHWTAWLELLVQGLHFWNPLFWIARRQLHRAAELACDGWVVARFPAERRAFAAALVDTAERASLGGFVSRAAQATRDRRDPRGSVPPHDPRERRGGRRGERRSSRRDACARA